MVESAARQPRSAVRINGKVIDGFTDWDVNNNAFNEADTFRIEFPARALPEGFQIDDLIDADELKVEILVGFPRDANRFSPGELHSIIVGNVDDLEYDPIQNTVVLPGRDYTAKLIDTKTTEKWPNNTASQIATLIAERHGLTPVVTSTTQTIGSYYEIDHARMGDSRSEWDILTWLASETLDTDGNKFVAYVQGNELHFEPGPTDTDTPYRLQIVKPGVEGGYTTFDGMAISFSRNLTVLRDVVVTVKSWNSKTKQAITASYPSNRSTSIAVGAAESERSQYTYSFPGLTHAQALQKAQALHHDITKHQVKLSATLVADNDLTPRRTIKVTGTGTRFDQTYYPDNVNRSFSIRGGYTMRVTAKNRSPESQT